MKKWGENEERKEIQAERKLLVINYRYLIKISITYVQEVESYGKI